MISLPVINLSGLEFGHLQQDRNFASPFVTLIVKGTFDIVPDGVCVLSDTQRPLSGDVRHMDDIGRSLAWSSDLVPYKPHSDVLVHGSFHAPNGLPGSRFRASLEFGPLYKRVLIFGPRLAVQAKGQRPTVTEPAAITSLPLRWEYSAGGLRDRRNPMGMGAGWREGPNGERIYDLPLIEDLDHPIAALSDHPDPVNFGPIPPFFQARQRKLGTRDQRWSMFRAPLPPQDFDPSYYNAAPRDQQGGNYPRGDETLRLTNLHPRHSLLTTRLPGLVVHAAVLREADGAVSAEPVTMHLDTVVALPDEDQLVLVWRGRCPVRDRRSEGELLRAAVAVEPLAGPRLDPPLPQLLMQQWQDARAAEASEALAAEQAGAEAAADQAAHVAETLESVRKLMGTAKFPPELVKLFATETDPDILLQHMGAFVDGVVADLKRRYPDLADP